MRRLDPGIPIVGSCSLADSASAHAGSEDKDGDFKDHKYGVVSENPKVRHNQSVSFSSRESS